ncbi:lipocalin family protein [Niabella sp.]|uniref:lipocalin family protein n=1 Tax=Niabella sp. TaxID=1962976 RepID=UPI0026097B2B|nr:lipocalin family protein [Niabella sp.]
MKRISQIVLLLITVSVIGTACSNSKKSASTTVPRQDFKGTWVVTGTSVEGTDTKNLKVEAFDDVALKCFEGSVWTFPNNGYGSYTINGQDCSAGPRQILWSTRNSNGVTNLNFKRVDGLKKNQSKNVAEGYSMEVTSSGKDHFIAQSPISFEGKTIYIVYNFQRQ